MAYLVRLKQLLNFQGNIQSLFRGKDATNSIQEAIWHEAKEYMLRQHGLFVEIPIQKFYRGRFVQYPLSQLLLKTEDLKRLTAFFAISFLPHENIPYPQFREALISWLPHKLPSRVCNLLENPQKREICFAQIFNYYLSWEGQILVSDLPEKSKRKYSTSFSSTPQPKIILLFEQGVPKYFLGDNSISANKLLEASAIRPNTGIILFNPLPGYDNDYEQSRYLLRNYPTWILVDRDKRWREFQFLERNAENKIILTSKLVMFQYTGMKTRKGHPLHDYFYHTNPIMLLGGIRLSRNNTYLKGFGPDIQYDHNIKVLFQGKSVDYQPGIALPGIYIVKTEEFRELNFSIEEVNNTDIPVPSLDTGWKLADLSWGNGPSFEGGLLYPKHEPTQDPIKIWVDILLDRPVKQDVYSQNILFRILKKCQSTNIKRSRAL